MGSILGIVGSLVIGGIVASATVVGVINAQTTASGDSPGNVNKPVIEYGSTK